MIMFLMILISPLVSCTDEDDPPVTDRLPIFDEGDSNKVESDWSIPESEVFDGGPGKDGIPALTDPEFIDADQATYLLDNDLVLGYKNGPHLRAYPHRILDWHEIVNDKINGSAITVNYCPLTGTGIGWNRIVAEEETTFGVSGLLYNSNLILYDRNTDSYWSQIKLECVHGKLRGTRAETYQLVETTWGTWKEMYPQTTVLSSATGYNRNYDRYPYGDYRTDNEYIIFPYNPVDTRLDAKERVHGVIIEDKAKAYRLGSFPGNPTLIRDGFNVTPYIVVGDATRNFIVSFKNELEDGTTLNYFQAYNSKETPSGILTDNEGNIWNIFGEAVSGPREGERLRPTTSFMGFWFAWGAFYPELQIYAFDSLD